MRQQLQLQKLKTFVKSEDGQLYDYLFHSERTQYSLGDASELTRLQLLFIVQCQVVYAEKLDDLEKRNKHADNPLTIYDTDDTETRTHKLAMIDEMIRASGQDLEYE
jgi:hypothetical protein